MDIMNLFESYCEFVDLSRELIEPSVWCYKSRKALRLLNEWFAVENEGVVTKEDMKMLEMKYRELHKDDLKNTRGIY